MIVYSQITDSINQEKKHTMAGQLSLFDIVSEEDKKDFEIRMPNVPEFDKEQILSYEKRGSGYLFKRSSAGKIQSNDG